MEDLILDDYFPEVPEELRGKDVRLPSEFRNVLANPKYKHEEIGRMVRCLLLNTDVFNDIKIGQAVFYFREVEKKKRYFRDAVKRAREKKNGNGEYNKNGLTVKPKHLTVKQVDITRKSGDLEPSEPIPLKKTPTIPKEKTPPIVPLKKNPPSFLENAKLEVQGDLFAPLDAPECQETRKERPQALPDVLDVKGFVQDIETHPRPVPDATDKMRTTPTGLDSRSDAAWIPQKFEMFWARYPRKVAKKDALKAFTKVIKTQKNVETFMRTLLASVEWWKNQTGWKKDGGKFIPYPATWLNRGSWEDSMENGSSGGIAEFLARSEESDEDLIRRMTGG